MNTDRHPTPHLQPAAFAHALDRRCAAGVTKQQIAAAAEVQPQHLSAFAAGTKNAGDKVRPRLAEALGVPESAITCWCPRPDGRCLAAEDNL
jgi:transcriptional regulator with XRE-family HTH domain